MVVLEFKTKALFRISDPVRHEFLQLFRTVQDPTRPAITVFSTLLALCVMSCRVSSREFPRTNLPALRSLAAEIRANDTLQGDGRVRLPPDVDASDLDPSDGGGGSGGDGHTRPSGPGGLDAVPDPQPVGKNGPISQLRPDDDVADLLLEHCFHSTKTIHISTEPFDAQTAGSDRMVVILDRAMSAGRLWTAYGGTLYGAPIGWREVDRQSPRRRTRGYLSDPDQSGGSLSVSTGSGSGSSPDDGSTAMTDEPSPPPLGGTEPVRVVVKVARPHLHKSAGDSLDIGEYDRDAARVAIMNKAAVYRRHLARLQGTFIPLFYGLYQRDDLYVMVLEDVGQPLATTTPQIKALPMHHR